MKKISHCWFFYDEYREQHNFSHINTRNNDFCIVVTDIFLSFIYKSLSREVILTRNTVITKHNNLRTIKQWVTVKPFISNATELR